MSYLPRRRRNRSLVPKVHPDPVALAAVLATENVSIGMYATMTALLRQGGKMPLMKLSLHVGQSYWAVRNHIRRTSYFAYEAEPGEKLIVRISDEGREKFTSIVRRIKQYTAGDTL